MKNKLYMNFTQMVHTNDVTQSHFGGIQIYIKKHFLYDICETWLKSSIERAGYINKI